jgi:hypothetical protein
MRRFVEEADRGQWTLLPECLDDFIDESNPVRVIDVFVDALDLAEMSFEGVEPAAKTIGCCRMTMRYQTSRADDAGLRQTALARGASARAGRDEGTTARHEQRNSAK